MTTIAYRDGVIAADTQATWGNTRDGEFVKIAKRGPLLAAGSGKVSAIQEFLDWFQRGCIGGAPPMPDGENSTFGVIIMPDDLMLTFGSIGCERTYNHTLAMGSGGEFAQGAMAAGATPEEAVRIAMRYDTKSGGDVTVLRR